MYISPRKKRLYTIISIIGALMVPVTVLAFLWYRDYRSRASATALPEDVRVSDLTDKSVVISWITPGLAVEGFVQYSDTPGVGSGSPITMDDRDVRSGTTGKRTTHYVTLSNLNPGTKYSFIIGSGTRTYKDKQNNEFTFTTATGAASGAIPTPDPLFGSVSNGRNQSAIVYVTLQKDGVKSFPVSGLTNDGGNFEVDLSHIRTADLGSKFSYSDSTEMIVFAQGGDIGGAVLRSSVGDRSAINLTMSENYPVTDIFADSSGREAGDEGDDIEDDWDDWDDDTVIGDRRQDVPLIPLVLGTTTGTGTGIDDVMLTNVTENSFTVIWESASREEGFVVYGDSLEDLTLQGIDDRDSLAGKSPYYMHHVTVKNLIPETTYYYAIVSGGQTYKDNGTPYTIVTPAIPDSPPEFDSVLGEVVGTGMADAVVIGSVSGTDGDSAQVSTAAGTNGRWTMSIGGIRTRDYSRYFSYSGADTLTVWGLAKGDEDVSTYTIGEIGESVLRVSLDIIAETGEPVDFERGLFATLAEITSLPITALTRIAVAAMILSVILILSGTIILRNAYVSEREKRWEKEVIERFEL